MESAMNLDLYLETLPSPFGEVMIVTDAAGVLRAVDFFDHEARMEKLLNRHYGAGRYRLSSAPKPTNARRRLEAYFGGDLSAIDDLPVETRGTAFQCEVWAALRAIPAGRTESYGDLAARIGRPKAVRAVGLANGANPVGIVVPCHRVIGANGTMTGYGGGVERKRALLAHEGALLPGT
jgi:methylated-DNA-[protein]-cysteine S-methyltransferase